MAARSERRRRGARGSLVASDPQTTTPEDPPPHVPSSNDRHYALRHGRSGRAGRPARPQRHARQRLEHHAVAGHGGDAGVVVGRRDLDEVEGAEVELAAMRRTARSSSRVVRPPGSGVPVPGAKAGSSDVDVDRQVGARRARAGVGDGVVEHGAAGRARRSRPSCASGSPGRASTGTRRGTARRRAGRSARCSRRACTPSVDAEVERRAVVVRVAVDLGAGVGVGVEVHDAVAVGAVAVGERLQRRPRQRVVAAEHRPGPRRRRGSRPTPRAGRRARPVSRLAGAASMSP